MPSQDMDNSKKDQTDPLPTTGGDNQHADEQANTTAQESLESIKYIKLLEPPFLTDAEPSDFPIKVNGEDYHWLLSKKGKENFEEMLQAADNCNADLWGIYVYNDFTGYGQFELMENAIIEYCKALIKVHKSPTELFFMVEGMILYLATDSGHWEMTEDGDRIIAMKNLFASIFLETFLVLYNEGLLTPESPIKNIGFVAALIVGWADCKRKSVARRIVRMCQNAGIEVSSGPGGFKDNVDVVGFMAGDSDDDSDDDESDDGYYDDEDEDEGEGEGEGKDEDEDEGKDGGGGEDDEWVDESRWKAEGKEEVDSQGSGLVKQLCIYRYTMPVPRMGGQEWNLSKWTEKELKRYSYEKEDGSINYTRPFSMFDPKGPYVN